MVTHTHPVASNFPIKTLVARRLPTNAHVHCTYVYLCIRVHTQHILTNTHTHTTLHTDALTHSIYIHMYTYHTCSYTYTHIHMMCTLHTVPSGHILTNLELQVLASLLATYTDEKLKEIQLSIQEKQGIHAISREEVERSLRQSGLTSIADGLKDNIEKGIINYHTSLWMTTVHSGC